MKVYATILVLTAGLTLATATMAAEETGQYCEVKPEACAVDRTASAPNELPTPEQIDWDNHPMYEHGGQAPKDAK